MVFDTEWRELRERAEQLGPETVLVTPDSGRAFDVAAVEENRVVVRYRETNESRTLRRDQFAFLADRLRGDPDGLALDDLPAGVEPYVAVLSLSGRYVVDDGRFRAATGEDEAEDAEADDGESPFVRPAWVARSAPERVHDDALLLAEYLGRYDADDLDALSADALTDLYVLLSDVQRESDRLRREVSTVLLDHIGPDARRHGQFGTVRRTHRERRHLRDDDVVFEALDDHSIPREWVVGVDAEKLDAVLATTDLPGEEVYDVEQQVYVQKTEVEEAAKQSHLQGLRDRLAELDAEDADRLRDEIDDLEARLDDLLAAG